MSHKQQAVSRGWNQQRKRIKLEQVGQDYNAFLQAYESKCYLSSVLSIFNMLLLPSSSRSIAILSMHMTNNTLVK